MITYQYRLYPNKSQKSLLWIHANKLNYLYNYFLNQKIEEYKNNNKSISKVEQQKELVILKQNDETLKQIHSQVLQQVTDRLDKTYKSFFKRGFGFPNFRSCKNFFGICYPQSGFSIDKDTIHTKAYGNIKFTKHRECIGNIKRICISEKNDKWFLNITTDYRKEEVLSEKSIGIDVGIANIVATSEGQIIKNCSHQKYFDKKINELKSRRDKTCKKNSRRFKFLSSTIRKLYGVKDLKINDFLHKVSKYLSSQYDTIFCEDLNLKDMSESEITGLNRELRNSQLGKFLSYLEYKTNHLVKVNPINTSKMCCKCGKIHEMKLSNRTMICECGYVEDRDINAAKNIYCLGQAIIASQLCIA